MNTGLYVKCSDCGVQEADLKLDHAEREPGLYDDGSDDRFYAKVEVYCLNCGKSISYVKLEGANMRHWHLDIVPVSAVVYKGSSL